MAMKLSDSSVDQYEVPFNYEKVVMDIWAHIPKNIQFKTFEGCYFHKDPCYKIELNNDIVILLRIWTRIMSEWYENQAKAEDGKVFISAYLNEGIMQSHLPLYWWYDHKNYSWIWNKILEKLN